MQQLPNGKSHQQESDLCDYHAYGSCMLDSSTLKLHDTGNGKFQNVYVCYHLQQRAADMRGMSFERQETLIFSTENVSRHKCRQRSQHKVCKARPEQRMSLRRRTNYLLIENERENHRMSDARTESETGNWQQRQWAFCLNCDPCHEVQTCIDLRMQ